MTDQLTFLGSNIPLALTRDFDAQLSWLLQRDSCQQIVTVNPEFLVRAHQDEDYRRVLNQADGATIDGFGLILLSLLTGKYQPGIRRITGVELTEKLLTKAQDQPLTVVVVLPANALAKRQEIAAALLQRYPRLPVGICYEQELSPDQVLTADIVLVSFGSPRQAIWIATEKRRLLSRVRVAVGVGGTLDFISGKIQRAPRWLRVSGLEWLWRLILEPWRWRRIFNAVIVFPWLVFTDRNTKPETWGKLQ